MKRNMPPDLVVGDFDSASVSALDWARKHGAKIIRQRSQDEPDFVKGLALCRKLHYKKVVIMGADGDRMDHTLISMFSAVREPKLDLLFVTAGTLVFPLHGKVSRWFCVPAKHPLSWIPLGEAKRCSLTGVKWPFYNRSLRIGGFHSLSNLPSDPEILLSQQSGNSLLIVGLKPQP